MNARLAVATLGMIVGMGFASTGQTAPLGKGHLESASSGRTLVSSRDGGSGRRHYRADKQRRSQSARRRSEWKPQNYGWVDVQPYRPGVDHPGNSGPPARPYYRLGDYAVWY
jgi:hypothetical protein